ncbi:transcriptional regulator [Acrocarpospora phusangensis]|uniref:Transcriptional regulator n=1 Tax=Acrocarpospora phusangensis TaxID=1070424 RepID=A0A919QBF1_9ACTN|nr:transcriptional regulator [Acrocarpospora phusangensis]
MRDFLRSRRARLTPPDVGLPWQVNGRRVAGLRREELAMAAGVSVDYYNRLEQGRAGNVSDQVLEAVGAVLRLSEAERRHLRDLIKARRDAAVQSSASAPLHARASLRMMLDALDPTPAHLLTAVLDVVGINRMGKTLMTDFEAMPRAERNMIRWIFLDPEARKIFADWEMVADECAGWLRTALSKVADDSRPKELIDELSAQSPEFARFWAAHGVTYCTYGRKRFNHPAVGTLTLSWESFVPTADPDLFLVVYHPAAGSPSAEMLATLAATPGA